MPRTTVYSGPNPMRTMTAFDPIKNVVAVKPTVGVTGVDARRSVMTQRAGNPVGTTVISAARPGRAPRPPVGSPGLPRRDYPLGTNPVVARRS